jgi:hypothetical protein
VTDNYSNRSMKPRKKQRIDTEDNDIPQSKKSKSKDTKKIKKQEPVIDEMEESSADEEQLEDEDDLPGTLLPFCSAQAY